MSEQTDSRVRAYHAIRERILRGQEPFGTGSPQEPTPERTIAEDYVEMSREPVREALAVLEATGVVDQELGVGAGVHETSPAEALQALQLRKGIEAAIVREVAKHGGELDLGALRDALEAMRQACAEGDQIDLMLADTDFHTELARLGGFDTSVTALQGFRDRVHLLRLRRPLARSEMDEIVGEHDAMVAAIEAENVEAAVRDAEAHLEAAIERISETG